MFPHHQGYDNGAEKHALCLLSQKTNTGGESFGIVLCEAMAAGTPVVASDLDAFRRVLADGEAGRLEPGLRTPMRLRRR